MICWERCAACIPCREGNRFSFLWLWHWGFRLVSSYRMNIESLFIDEGFGSLDAETLGVAMDALEHLQIQGRKIGVISHVAEMTERIPIQVQVRRVANGRSRITVVEV